MLTYYFNAIAATFVRYSIDLTQPLHSLQLTTLLEKYTYYTHPIFAMSFFRGDLCLEDQLEIYQLPLHSIALNFHSWCRCIQESTIFAPSKANGCFQTHWLAGLSLSARSDFWIPILDADIGVDRGPHMLSIFDRLQCHTVQSHGDYNFVQSGIWVLRHHVHRIQQ